MDHGQEGHTQETEPRTILGFVTLRAEVPLECKPKRSI